MKIFSKNTWGVDVNNAWPLTCKASCLKKIELRPLISGFYCIVGGTGSVRGFPTVCKISIFHADHTTNMTTIGSSYL